MGCRRGNYEPERSGDGAEGGGGRRNIGREGREGKDMVDTALGQFCGA